MWGIEPIETMGIASVILDSVAGWFFCCVMSVYVIPVIFDRVVFHLPKMIQLHRSKEVMLRGIFYSVGEIILWVGILFTAYTYLYLFQPNLFFLTTRSQAAFMAWGISIAHMVYRILNFDRIIKRKFYYVAYMRHIEPRALQAYQGFIEDLDIMAVGEIMALLETELPYMHRQAAMRKQNELLNK